MFHARRVGAEVFCDLVPHDRHEELTVDQCRLWLADATIVGSSAATLARLIDPAGRRPVSEDSAAATTLAAERLLEVLELTTQRLDYEG